MTYILLLLLSFSAWSQEALHTYGSKDRPQPFDAESFSLTAVTYESVDWRNKEGMNWLGPIRNQSNCGACVAFATVATLEDQQTISTRAAWKREAFSQEALFSCGRAKCNSGWFILDAARTVEKIGVVDIACAPYKAGSAGKTIACGTFCESQGERTLKIKAITHPNGAAEVKEYLKNKGPLFTTMSVRTGFDSYSGGIFKASINDDVLGGHAVELVGFNDTERYWIIKNSWGPDWGENGFARMSYDDVSGVGTDTYGFDVDEKAEGFETPLDHEYVQGTVTVKGKIADVELTQNDHVLKSLACNGNCTIDTKTLSDGEYVLRAVGTSGRIMTRRFSVLNTVPDFKMTVKSAVGSDFNYPQFGRLLFDASFVGNQVPELLIMEIRQKGKLVTSRSVREVFATTRIGFNSNALKDGPYEISFKHKTFGKVVEGNVFKVTIKND